MESLDEKIRSAYELEKDSGPIFTRAEIPGSYDKVTPEWLTDILCPPGSDVRVERFELAPADDGTTNRRRIFLTYSGKREGLDLPDAIFCKGTHDLANRLLIAHTGGARCESVFYNKVREHLDIESPHCYFAALEPDTLRSIVVLGDIADEVDFCDQDTHIALDDAKSQLSLLASVHAPFLGAASKREVLAELPTWPERFANIQRWRLEERCKSSFAALEAIIPPRLFARADDIWPATLESVADHHHLPHTLNHNDVHLKNWYRTHAGRMGVTDWQCASRGHWGRDVAYVMSTSLKVDDRRAWQDALFQHYADEMARRGQPVSINEIVLNYRRQLMTVLAWWTFTYAPAADMPEMQPPATCIEFITRISAAADDVDSLGAF